MGATSNSEHLKPRAARYRVETLGGVTQLRIPIGRHRPTLIFLPLLLAAGIAEGVRKWTQLVTTESTLELIWFSTWALGWLFLAGMLATQLFGEEIVRVMNRNLEVTRGIGPLRKTWRYRGEEIRELSGWLPDIGTFGQPILPDWIFRRPLTGAVKFDYGDERVFLAAGLDEVEGQPIAAWLGRRLSRGAMEGCD